MPMRIAIVAPNAAIGARAKSTKVTPRSTKVTPREAGMHVRMRDARTRRDVTDHVEAEVLGEVWPGFVVADHFAAAVGLHFVVPFLFGGGEALVEISVALLEIGGLAGLHLGELIGDAFGDATAVIWVEPVMGITQRMHVALGARDQAGGLFHDF